MLCPSCSLCFCSSRRCGTGGGGGGFPATLSDVATAIDYISADAAQYSLDTSRVALLGHSAGAALAMWAAQRGSLPQRAGGSGGDDEMTAVGLLEADALRAVLPPPPSLRPRCVVSAGGVLDVHPILTSIQYKAARAVNHCILSSHITVGVAATDVKAPVNHYTLDL